MSLSEEFRLAAKDWVDRDAAASLLEETKSAYLAQMMAKLGDVPVSHAEREVKSSDEWKSFVVNMVDARKSANLAKVKMEWIRMRFSEQQSAQATARAEMKL
jgi:hypothetical protein